MTDTKQTKFHLVTKKSGKLTIHAELVAEICQAAAEYGFRAKGIDTKGKDVRWDVSNQKNISGLSTEFVQVVATNFECQTQRLLEICSRSFYSDWDYFWDQQGNSEIDKELIFTEWKKHHT